VTKTYSGGKRDSNLKSRREDFPLEIGRPLPFQGPVCLEYGSLKRFKVFPLRAEAGRVKEEKVEGREGKGEVKRLEKTWSGR